MPALPACARIRGLTSRLKLQVVSDLHLESAPLAPFAVTGDVLVIAGDTHDEPEQLHRFVAALPGGTPVIVVLGNHEFDHKEFAPALPAYRTALSGIPNVHLLERDSLAIDGVTFMGANLWTDMRGGLDAPAVARVLAAFDMRGVSVDDLIALHRETLRWLEASYPGDAGRVVVVTHTAPSLHSQHPRFAGSALNGFFTSDLDALVQRLSPDVWIHGHVHDPFDYTIGRTHVVCHPRGYPGENPKWQPYGKMIEL